MPMKYLDGEDRLVLWPADQQTWMRLLEAKEFSEDELAEIDRIEQAFWELQKKLQQRFGFNRFYR